MPTNAGTEKEWLRAIVTDKVAKATTWTSKETKELGPGRPESRIQEILQQFYWDLVDKLKEAKFTEGGEIITAPDGTPSTNGMRTWTWQPTRRSRS